MTAFAKVQAAAEDIGVADEVFAAWADALRFQCATIATMTEPW